MLLLTGIELDLVTELKMLDMIERQKRGGLCFVGSKRHVKANNKYLDDFDINKPSNYLMYWDANNLYGWAMSQYLPFANLTLNKVIPVDQALETIIKQVIETVDDCDKLDIIHDYAFNT